MDERSTARSDSTESRPRPVRPGKVRPERPQMVSPTRCSCGGNIDEADSICNMCGYDFELGAHMRLT